MTKLYYVGFNGYHQCPNNQEGLPKTIKNWTLIVEDGDVKACTHRFVIVESKELFKIYGTLKSTSTERLQVLTKPAKIDNFGSCDEFLISSVGTNIWKFNYNSFEWAKCDLKFFNEEEKSAWKDTGNRILKFSFQQNLSHVLILLSNGSVWMLSREEKIKILFPHDLDKAVDVCSGLEHSLILTESGCVLALGNGRGQLGHGDLNSTLQPVQIEALEGLRVVKIATGGWHSCAITDSGDLYTWGWNNFGQLSAFEDGKEVGLTALPGFVEVGEEPEIKVVDVVCGKRHTVALLENGDLYSTGWNAYSQLGVDSPSEKVLKFTKCQIQRNRNRKVICGPWYTILMEELVELGGRGKCQDSDALKVKLDSSDCA